MEKINNCVGKKIVGVIYKKNKDFISKENELLLDELILVFEKQKIRISPDVITDEIIIEEYSNDKNMILEDYEELESDYLNRNLQMAWKGINSNGYFDAVILSFHQLHPDIFILSEGSVLKLFNVSQRS